MAQPQCANVLGTIEVGIACPSTGRIGTGKRFTLASTEMQTGMARLGGISRLYQYHWDTSQGGFVDDKLPQLEERPTIAMAPCRLRPGLLVRTLPNAAQVFQSDGHIGVLGSLDQGFGDTVVGVPLK